MAQVPEAGVSLFTRSERNVCDMSEGFAIWFEFEMRRWDLEINGQWLMIRVEEMGKAQKERVESDGFEWHMSHHKYHLEYAMNKMYDILGADELAQQGTAEERAKMNEKFERFRAQRHIAMLRGASWVASMTGDETIESLHAEYVEAFVTHYQSQIDAAS